MGIFFAYLFSCFNIHKIWVLCIFGLYLFSRIPFKRKFRVFNFGKSTKIRAIRRNMYMRKLVRLSKQTLRNVKKIVLQTIRKTAMIYGNRYWLLSVTWQLELLKIAVLPFQNCISKERAIKIDGAENLWSVSSGYIYERALYTMHSFGQEVLKGKLKIHPWSHHPSLCNLMWYCAQD